MRKVSFVLAIVLTVAVVWLGLQGKSARLPDPAVAATVPAAPPALPPIVRIDISGQSLAERSGSTFLPLPSDPYRSPRIRFLDVPDFPGANAIWGSTGRDRRGHIWFGVSVIRGEYSAHLVEYDPGRDMMIDRGDVISNLKAAGLHRRGERQIKIHSRIVQADDGYLYFTSTDEQGEGSDGSAPPKWGSHLWRLLPGEDRWEHLHAVPEGLTAAAGGGRWVYALGLWDHVLYQYDTQTGALKRKVVGSLGGHMSRNFIADLRGHVFVPRVDEVGAMLVEFDSDLREIGQTPLLNYMKEGRPKASHGITGVVYLADGSMAIAVNQGSLYRLLPQSRGATIVERLGTFLEDETRYTPSLFTLSGERFLLGITRKKRKGRKDRQRYAWLVFDLLSGRSELVEFPLEGKALLYGSITRDVAGRFYVTGRRKNPESGRNEPLVLQLDIGR